MSFAENLRYELDYQSLVVKELSSKTGVNINTLNHYLSGRKSMPPADVAVKIASALGVTVEYLVTGMVKDEPNPQQTSQIDYAKNIQKYLQFHEVVDYLSVLPPDLLKPVEAMIKTAAISKKY
jgi:transcriptional regulator with XRE-family HTH domain